MGKFVEKEAANNSALLGEMAKIIDKDIEAFKAKKEHVCLESFVLTGEKN